MKTNNLFQSLRSIALLMMAAGPIIGCTNDEVLDFLTIETLSQSGGKDFTLPLKGGAQTVSFKASGEWTVTTDDQRWYTVTPTNGNGDATITIKADPFDAYSAPSFSRVALITLTCGSVHEQFSIMQSDPSASEDPVSSTVKSRARGGKMTVEIPEALAYSVVVNDNWLTASADAGVLTLNLTRNTGSENRETVVKVMSANGENEIASVGITQSWRNVEPGELLIEEIYFTGTPLPSTGKTNTKNTDQYFLITNNTDELLYADSLLIIESKNPNAGSTWKEFKEPIIDEYCEAGVVMCIPGSGTDNPLEPGESLVIASNGINFKEGYSGESGTTVEMNPDGLDLSKADYEWYTESTNSVIDIDIPEVPNVDMWFCYTLSILNLHDRGFQSYAIAMPPATMTKEKFLEDYNWAGAVYTNHTLAGDFEMTLTNAYKVPNSWIIDAVMCTVPSIKQTRQFSTTLDAGWTYASPQNIDKDAQRYGHSVLRNRNAETGKLVDTDNSTNDFTPNATPSLLGK